jgi:hypothetical protein
VSRSGVHDVGAPAEGRGRPQRSDAECRAVAIDMLATLIGATPDLWWDAEYHLKGDVRVGGCDLVLIATRDLAHQPVVLRSADWEEVRRAPASERSGLLRRYAISSRRRLADVLAVAAA